MQIKELSVIGESVRADIFVANELEITRSHAATLFANNNVLLGGKSISKNTKLKNGNVLVVNIPDPTPLNVVAQNIPLEIVYEDNYLLVVSKPKGMVVHPANGNSENTLVNALLHHCKDSLSGINGVLRPGIVHRIDKDTSGLLIVAKSDEAHIGLAEQIKEHSFTREYEAVVYGSFKEKNGTINAPIGRHPIKRKQMAVTDYNSKFAVTHYTVLKEYNGFSYVRLRLETGRTHQIRVHMSYIGHAVAGDTVYGPKKAITKLGGQCLHAKKIGFIHPITKQYLEFESELPEYFTAFLKECETFE